MSTEIEKAVDNELSFVGGAGASISTVDLSTFEGKVKNLNAIQNAQSANDYIGKTLNVTDVIFQQAQFVDEETGEISDGIRTILLLDDDTAVAFASDVIVRNVKTIIATFGSPENWPHHMLPLKVEQRQGKGTHRFYQLSVDVKGLKK